ncbi:TPA: hypothetical protein EYP66_05735 [Candidatus Poribacteria bacterium]|nr:hypothetical protein [Candidatus Poribacteria bacterium]
METIQDYFNYITGLVDKCPIIINRAALYRGGGKVLAAIMAPDRRRHQPGVPDGLLFRERIRPYSGRRHL